MPVVFGHRWPEEIESRLFQGDDGQWNYYFHGYRHGTFGTKEQALEALHQAPDKHTPPGLFPLLQLCRECQAIREAFKQGPSPVAISFEGHAP